MNVPRRERLCNTLQLLTQTLTAPKAEQNGGSVPLFTQRLPITDTELMIAVAAGDETATAAINERHYPLIIKAAARKLDQEAADRRPRPRSRVSVR